MVLNTLRMAPLCKSQKEHTLFCSVLYQELLTVVENHITNRNAANGDEVSHIPALVFIHSCHMDGDCTLGNSHLCHCLPG